MLTTILKRFQETDQPLNFETLSRELGIEKSALEGMLQTLVRQGKLKVVTPGSGECSHCRSRKTCGALQSNHLGTIYELVKSG